MNIRRLLLGALAEIFDLPRVDEPLDGEVADVLTLELPQQRDGVIVRCDDALRRGHPHRVHLRRRLGVRVRMRAAGAKGAGVVEIPYASLDELDRLLSNGVDGLGRGHGAPAR